MLQKINFTKLGLVRREDEDFTDDGNRFKVYYLRLDGGKYIRMTSLTDDGMRYICFDLSTVIRDGSYDYSKYDLDFNTIFIRVNEIAQRYNGKYGVTQEDVEKQIADLKEALIPVMNYKYKELNFYRFNEVYLSTRVVERVTCFDQRYEYSDKTTLVSQYIINSLKKSCKVNVVDLEPVKHD